MCTAEEKRSNISKNFQIPLDIRGIFLYNQQAVKLNIFTHSKKEGENWQKILK